jgi:hypothetical protein
MAALSQFSTSAGAFAMGVRAKVTLLTLPVQA